MTSQLKSSLSLPEIISALSFALDLTEGQPMGHALRSCLIGMRIAGEIGLDPSSQSDLYYALLLKDAGCSSNSSKMFHLLASDEIRAKREVKTTDWTRVGWDSLQYALRNVRTGAPIWERIRGLVAVTAGKKRSSWELIKIRCERGANVARNINLPEPTALAIYSLDEHWNGAGYPDGLKGSAIPLLSRIMNLAQTLDVYNGPHGASAAMQIARKRSGRWFDPGLVKAAASLYSRGSLFEGLDPVGLKARVAELEPSQAAIRTTGETLDQVCQAFAEVIDAKSPFTYQHSTGVAHAAVTIATRLGLDGQAVRMISRAALLHDIGKLSVPNSILEKPAKLEPFEWDIVKQHPFYTLEILRKVPCFGEISEVAASHHEKLNGSGYFRNMDASSLSLPARILAVADIYDALAAPRPYRAAMDHDAVFQILRKEAPHALDGDCVEALADGGAPMDLGLFRTASASSR
jgi:putative nucleotidyltransferase with HDIG domain